MSMILSTLHRRGATLSVAVANTLRERQAVQRLRHQIYVREMGLLAQDHPFVRGDRLVDPFDDWSTHIVGLVNGEPVGTVRVTEALDGPLELEEYTDVRSALPEGAHPAELTRYMVRRDHRKTAVGPLVLYGAFLVIARSASTHLTAAAKEGSLGTYYRSAGLRVIDDEPFTYGLTGCRYVLGTIDCGAPGSLRRTLMRTWYGALRLGAGQTAAVENLLFRRRLRPGRPVAPATERIEEQAA